jgi:hypothetical protein
VSKNRVSQLIQHTPDLSCVDLGALNEPCSPALRFSCCFSFSRRPDVRLVVCC